MPSREWTRSGRSWTAALAAMEGDRMPRPEIREERLRAAAGLRGDPAVALSAWRGRSGRRYVVSVLDVDDALTRDEAEAVILGVRRGNDGLATLLGLGHAGTIAEGAALAAADGATEIHVHRLAVTPAAREAIVCDLLDDDERAARCDRPVGAARPVLGDRPGAARGEPASAAGRRGRRRTARSLSGPTRGR